MHTSIHNSPSQSLQGGNRPYICRLWMDRWPEYDRSRLSHEKEPLFYYNTLSLESRILVENKLGTRVVYCAFLFMWNIYSWNPQTPSSCQGLGVDPWLTAHLIGGTSVCLGKVMVVNLWLRQNLLSQTLQRMYFVLCKSYWTKLLQENREVGDKLTAAKKRQMMTTVGNASPLGAFGGSI